MNFEDLRLFVMTLNEGSFTAAADKLGLSKQFVSRRTMALEESLGVRLLNRTTRRLQATELGMLLYERAVKILEDVNDTEELLSSRRTVPQGVLRVSAPMTFGTLHLSPLLPDFLSAYPQIRLELDLNDRAVDLLAEGYDMSIRIGTLADSSLIAKRLTEMQLVTCASPDYLRQAPPLMEPEDLAGHSCLLYGHGRQVEWRFQRGGKPLALSMQGQLRANNGEVVRDAAIAGQGIAVLPTFIIGAALASGALVQVLEDFALPSAAVYAVYPQHRQSARIVQLFSDYLRDRLTVQPTHATVPRIG